MSNKRKTRMTASELQQLWQDHATAALLAERYMRGLGQQVAESTFPEDHGEEDTPDDDAA